MVERRGQNFRQLFGKLKCLWMAKLKWRRVIIVKHLGIDSLGNFLAPVPGGDVEKPGRAVNQPVAPFIPQKHAFALGNQPWRIFEIAVGSKRHPIGFERVIADRLAALLRRCNVHLVIPVKAASGRC